MPTNGNYQLTDLQQKILNDMSKSEARPVEQCLNMLIDDGLSFFYCEHVAPYAPYLKEDSYRDELIKAVGEDWK